MQCEELLKALSDYVDGDVAPTICEEFEKHLAGCNPCQVVIDNIRQTILLYQNDEPYPLPPEFQQKLHECMRKRWQQQFAGKGK